MPFEMMQARIVFACWVQVCGLVAVIMELMNAHHLPVSHSLCNFHFPPWTSHATTAYRFTELLQINWDETAAIMTIATKTLNDGGESQKTDYQRRVNAS